MQFAKWALALLVVYLLASVGVTFATSEVATVETRDVRGGALQTSVWVVDLSGDVWIRASFPDAMWLSRLREDPNVTLIREGERSQRRALIVDGVQERIDQGMRAKYGRADEAFAYLRNPYESVVIRLDAVAEADRWSEAYP